MNDCLSYWSGTVAGVMTASVLWGCGWLSHNTQTQFMAALFKNLAVM